MGYHRLVRWVATRQPLSLAASRVPRAFAPHPLAALLMPGADPEPSSAAESAALPEQVSYEAERFATSVDAEPPVDSSTAALASSISPLAAPSFAPPVARVVAREAAPQQAERTAAVVNTPVVSDGRAAPATASAIPAADQSLVAPAPPVAPVPVAAVPEHGGRRDEVTPPAPQVARAAVPPAMGGATSNNDAFVLRGPRAGDSWVPATESATSKNDASRTASQATQPVPPAMESAIPPHDALMAGEAIRDAALAAQPTPTVQTSQAAVTGSDTDAPDSIRAVQAGDLAGSPAVPTVPAAAARVPDDEQRSDRRPIAHSAGDALDDALIDQVAATPRVPAVDALGAAPAVTPGDGADIEIVAPRRPRPQVPLSDGTARSRRLPSPEGGAPGAEPTANEGAAGPVRASTPQAPAAQASPEIPPPGGSALEALAAVVRADEGAEELFAPREADRSPESWVARLTGRAPVAPPPSPPSPPASPALATSAQETLPVAEVPVVAETPARRAVAAVRAPGRAELASPDGALSAPAAPVRAATSVTPAIPTMPVAPVVTPAVPTTPAAPAATAEPTPPGPRVSSAAAAPALPVASRPPTPLPDSVRRFLQPLVGIDPASVRVYSDPAATQLTARVNADGLAIGDTVALGAGHLPGAGTPETLGLLAHELTHVARGREPRFVPPIARAEGRRMSDGGAVTVPTNEEAVARLVEARVTRAAESVQAAESAQVAEPWSSAQPDDVPVRFVAPLVTERGRPGTIGVASARADAGLGQPAAVIAADTDRAAPAWNGLPAPWQPLPTWLDAGAAPTVGALPLAVASPATPAFTAPATAAPAVQLAEPGRAVDEAATTAPAHAADQHAAQPPAPDLDALARQVYTVLRRRLSAEGRRAW